MRNNGPLEQEPFLIIEMEDTLGGPPTMKHENEKFTEARRNGKRTVVHVL